MKRARGIRGKLDQVFSELVRERSNWTCEYSGKQFTNGNRMGIHCSHLFSRRHLATRWHPDNAFAHSYSAHSYLGGNPVIFVSWAESQLGSGRLEMLRERHNMTMRYREKDLREMLAHYQLALVGMKAQRADGVAGRIEFPAWD